MCLQRPTTTSPAPTLRPDGLPPQFLRLVVDNEAAQCACAASLSDVSSEECDNKLLDVRPTFVDCSAAAITARIGTWSPAPHSLWLPVPLFLPTPISLECPSRKSLSSVEAGQSKSSYAVKYLPRHDSNDWPMMSLIRPSASPRAADYTLVRPCQPPSPVYLLTTPN